MISPICIATVHGRGLGVLLQSVKSYCPEVPVYLRGPESVIAGFDADLKVFGTPRTFGEDYNEVIDAAMRDGFASVLAVNDDVVLTPRSYADLMADVKVVLSDPQVGKVGWVSARSDNCRPQQNVRFNPFDQRISYGRFAWEGDIAQIDVISPIFSWISRDAWDVCRFAPLNWYSDDVHCEDLNALGFKHFLSRSYVHHVGSMTIGMDGERLTRQAMPWLRENRPQYVEEWFESSSAG